MTAVTPSSAALAIKVEWSPRMPLSNAPTTAMAPTQ